MPSVRLEQNKESAEVEKNSDACNETVIYEAGVTIEGKAGIAGIPNLLKAIDAETAVAKTTGSPTTMALKATFII